MRQCQKKESNHEINEPTNEKVCGKKMKECESKLSNRNLFFEKKSVSFDNKNWLFRERAVSVFQERIRRLPERQ